MVVDVGLWGISRAWGFRLGIGVGLMVPFGSVVRCF